MVGATMSKVERTFIIARRQDGVEITEIAAHLGCHRATIFYILAASQGFDESISPDVVSRGKLPRGLMHSYAMLQVGIPS